MYDDYGVGDTVKSNMEVEDVERRPEEMRKDGEGSQWRSCEIITEDDQGGVGKRHKKI